MNTITLAKNVFAVHGVNDSGKPALVKPKVSRAFICLRNLPYNDCFRLDAVVSDLTFERHKMARLRH